jgi:hypothetical protein
MPGKAEPFWNEWAPLMLFTAQEYPAFIFIEVYPRGEGHDPSQSKIEVHSDSKVYSGVGRSAVLVVETGRRGGDRGLGPGR